MQETGILQMDSIVYSSYQYRTVYPPFWAQYPQINSTDWWDQLVPVLGLIFRTFIYIIWIGWIKQLFKIMKANQKIQDKYLFKLSALPFSIILAVAGSIFSSTISIQIPRWSIPRRPARPLIWMYSPLDNHLNRSPSNFRTLVNTTVFAGMFKPILNVSVANKHYNTRFNQQNIKCNSKHHSNPSNTKDWNVNILRGIRPSFVRTRIKKHNVNRFLNVNTVAASLFINLYV